MGAEDCPAVSEDTGLRCQKKLYHAQNNELWDHLGGHIFASPLTMLNLETKHYDAGKLLNGEPVTFHDAETCDYSGFCAWRKTNS